MSGVLLRDVAQRAGVSMATASVVLSNSPGARIAEATRERVLAAAAEVGYRPRRRGSPGAALGLTQADPAIPWSPAFLAGLVGEATRRGRVVAVLPADGGSSAAGFAGSRLRWEGLVAFRGSAGAEATLPLGTRVLVDLSGGQAPLHGEWPGVVAPHDHAAAVDVADALRARGHRRVALVGAAAEADLARRWAEGLRTRYAPSELRSEVVVDPQGATAWADATLREPAEGRPSAVICLSEATATAVHSVADGLGAAAGLPILARTGELGAGAVGAICGIRLPETALGRAAADLVISGRSGTPHSGPPTTLVPFDAAAIAGALRRIPAVPEA